MRSLQDHLNLKIKLEQRLTRDLARFVRQYLAAWGEARDSGASLPRTGWQNRLAALLAQHYGRVIVAVDGAGDAMLPLRHLRDATTAARLIDQANAQAMMIMSRIEREIAAADAQAMTSKGFALDYSYKAAKTKFSVQVVSTMKQVWGKIKRSLGTIANMNTQGVAEEAAAAPLVEIVPNNAGAETWYKQWVSMEDHKVRPHHQAAHGQVVKIEDPYTVGGELLRYPGDQSMGASLGNVINCRCMSAYGVMRDGKFQQVGDLQTVRGTARPVRRPGTKPGSAAPRVPTRAFTFATGNSRRKIILSNGQDANVSVGNGAITIRVGGKPVASAPLKRDALGKFTLGPLTTAPTHRGIDFQRLLDASVEATNGLRIAP